MTAGDGPAGDGKGDAATRLARLRTVFAFERTFLAGVRTGLSLTTVGVAIEKAIRLEGMPWLPRTIGVILIIGGGFTFYRSWRKASSLRRYLEPELSEVAPRWAHSTFAALLLVVAVLALVLIA